MESIIKVFGIDWRLLVIQAFNFSLVLIVLYIYLYKPVLALLDERKNKIEEGLRDAEQSKSALLNATTEASEVKGQALKDADKIISDSKRIAEEKEKLILAEAQDKAAKTTADTIKENLLLRQHALKESEEEIARLGVLAAEKILETKAL